ncbi:hypothetical protein [Amycolatopsis pithecellobii]|uniref:Integral membrane protein n=1 Tax=Amycolatopsis pithecellobii TaxID=664692 RepID=A0A6N7YWY6_9PSEU|nr:hypothetical protein [Amycolatopsis pithecellobii]MTD52849.1 hypothetical protein [Amycolatopsis pithecellobii]
MSAEDDGTRLTFDPTVTHGAVLWLFAAFVVTFVVTRTVVRLIRSGRGPFRDTTVGGVHVHHHVYGIFLMLAAGVAEFVYTPGTPWVQIFAAVFGAGAALTLDEFALWLYLDDVYWTEQGRKSVDLVFGAALVGLLLVLGARPFEDTAGDGRISFAVTIAVNLVFALVALLKGKTASGVVGLVVPLVALVAAIRLAKPSSPWARKRYPVDSRKWERATARFPEGGRARWTHLVDRVAGSPATLTERRH